MNLLLIFYTLKIKRYLNEKKNLKVKYVQYVKEVFFGEKNGYLIGIKLNIVLKNVLLTEILYN